MITLRTTGHEGQADLTKAEQALDNASALYRNSGMFQGSRPFEVVKSLKPANGKNGSRHGALLQVESWSPLLRQLDSGIEKSSEFLLKMQHEDGYWWHELESNVTITAEYIMLLYILGLLDPQRKKSMVKYLLGQQAPNGSWALYYGDGGELSITVEAYFALKLAGEDASSEPMKKAREYILQRGGIEATRVFTRVWLALFSQYDWKKIPSMPVELVLLPSHAYFSIYEFSSWARGTIVPLAIVMAIRPATELPRDRGVSELYAPDGLESSVKPFAASSYTHKTFYLMDRIVKLLEQRHPFPSIRNRAIRAAEEWIVAHQEESGDWGGIQPPMVYSILALHYLGYCRNHEVMARGLKALEDFCCEDDAGYRMQSCISPVWDSALTSIALSDSGVSADHPALEKTASWLLSKQVTTGGDWQVKNCCPPGGWAFEFVNTRYPDVDDSAVVIIALQKALSHLRERAECALSRGMEWCLSMQCETGGWAAFDKDNLMVILNRIPFGDTEAMVDYPTADVTGRVLEAMGFSGYSIPHKRVQMAIKFLKDLQEPDGSWWGRWGVNYIYGTWSVLRGLTVIGEDMKTPYVARALRWLKDHQNPDGGWGETCASYKEPALGGKGPSTPSQTAWAVMGLVAGGEEMSVEARKGVQYLLRTQKPDGAWDEEFFTGTGFPNHFYIRYHGYRLYFPLMALGQYRKKIEGRHLDAAAL